MGLKLCFICASNLTLITHSKCSAGRKNEGKDPADLSLHFCPQLFGGTERAGERERVDFQPLPAPPSPSQWPRGMPRMLA